jgi:septum site-determining protein MinC
MNRNIVIKSTKHGLALYLSEDCSFELLKTEIRKKFSESKKFFGSAEVALTLEGKTLNSLEINELIDIISEETDLSIIAVIDNSEINDKLTTDKLKQIFSGLDTRACEIYNDSVGEGESLEFKHSVIIIGDVAIDSEVHTNGSVFILGCCYGKIYAGELGNKEAVVYAALMNPVEINIADISFDLDILQNETEVRKRSLFGRPKAVHPECLSYILSLDTQGECVYTKLQTH